MKEKSFPHPSKEKWDRFKAARAGSGFQETAHVSARDEGGYLFLHARPARDPLEERCSV